MRSSTFTLVLVMGLLMLTPGAASAAYVLEPDVPVVYADDVPGEDFDMVCEDFGVIGKPGIGVVFDPSHWYIPFMVESCTGTMVEELAWNLVTNAYTGTRHIIIVDANEMGSEEFRWDFEGMASTTAPWYLGHIEIQTSADNRP